jgi:crotonobetainyl-CoA:carnitine CoA-transferase CaiB-like acyl-CoA transferase
VVLPLDGVAIPLGDGAAFVPAAALLRALGAAVDSAVDERGGRVDEAAAWAGSGAMALTGDVGGPPRVPAGAVAGRVAGAALAWEALARALGLVDPAPLDGPALLGERAALLGLGPGGASSCGGSCRLVAAADGLVAVNLPRDDDLATVAAWVAPVLDDVVGRPWDLVERALPRWTAAAAVARAAELGLPVARVADSPQHACADEQGAARGQTVDPGPWLLDGERPDPSAAARPAAAAGCPGAGAAGARPARRPDRPPLVVDLTSLWAGPLATQLLRLAGCRTVKVEHARRPDGTRRSSRAFLDLLHGGTECVAVDPAAPADRALLHALVARADVVLEALRPAGAARLGLDADRWRARRPGLVWVSISGYGRTGPWADRPALGDDAAAAGGAVAVATGVGLGPVHLADALADPLTGLHAAVVTLAGLVGRIGLHADVALREVVAHVLRDARPGGAVADPGTHPVAPPRARRPTVPAPAPGAHTAAWRTELALA